MKTTDTPIIVEQEFSTSKDELWQALTNAEEMKLWFFEQMENFEAKEGFETRFDVSSEEKVFPHIWKVKKVVAEEILTVNWTFEGYEGSSDVSFELSEINECCTLKVSTIVLEDFDDSIPEFKRESCEGGWKYFIQERLVEYMKVE